ncbi:SDR family NAD(P)-dependent oxidoreductase [Kitasatospora sp. LaBMicrA B282]|uniref:SDR family NAD(P)-dependent oxidoreductase n=1 Tax=Kitasatospora sp. LaBMicrA B282 TaxID=3420949 RepID=UPI003D0AF0F0
MSSRNAASADARTIVLVGATSGIGRQAAVQLASRGHRLILVGRNAGRGQALLAALGGASTAAPPVFVAGDVSTRSGVEQVARAVRAKTGAVDTLINNAGVMVSPRRVTDEGMELNFAVHHLAPYSMTGLLLPLLDRGDGRIVNTNSEGHRAAVFGGSADLDFEDLQSARRYDTFGAYSRTKLANLLFTYEFQRRHPRYSMVAVHPGMVRTRLVRSVYNPAIRLLTATTRWFLLPPSQGAKPLVQLATAATVQPGRYYDRFTPVSSSPASLDRHTARRLWAETERLRGPFAELAR